MPKPGIPDKTDIPDIQYSQKDFVPGVDYNDLVPQKYPRGYGYMANFQVRGISSQKTLEE